VSNERQPSAQRFGHYQAIAALDGHGEARLWHAWDPYLGRFVVVASLASLDAAALEAALPNLDAALRRWTGVAAYRAGDVLHFFPGSDSEDAYIVLSPAGTSSGGAAAAPPETAARRDLTFWLPLALATLAILGLPLFLYLGSLGPGSAPPPPIVVPRAPTHTECIPPTATSSPTAVPTATPGPQPPAKRQAAAPKAAPAADIGAPVAPKPEPPVTTFIPADPEESRARGVQPGTVTAMTRRMVGAETLVREWLLRHCHEVERGYLAAGRNFACGWMGVAIDGALPELTVTFTRIDRNLPTGRDLYTNRSVRLLCTDHCITLQEDTTTAEVY
jgi:hypothetical protein